MAVMARSGSEVSELYGSPMGVHNPREYQHVDLRGLGAQQGTGAGVRRGARRQDVVDQDDAAAGNLAAAFRGNLERTLDVAGALGPGQPDLLFGRPDAPERLGGQFHATLPRNHSRQRAGLVVAAAPAASPMQGNRHQ